MLITGLRGVGKTVLSGAFENRPLLKRLGYISAEITKNEDFGPRMGSGPARPLPGCSQGGASRQSAQATGALKSFSVTVTAEGAITAGIDIEPLEGTAHSGNLSDDHRFLPALGEAAQEREKWPFLVDEVQFLRAAEFEAWACTASCR